MSYRSDRLKRSGPPLSSRGMIASKVVLTNQPLDRARKKRRFLDSISVESEDILVWTPGFFDVTKILKVDNDNIKVNMTLTTSMMTDLDSLINFFYKILRYRILENKMCLYEGAIYAICTYSKLFHWHWIMLDTNKIWFL